MTKVICHRLMILINRSKRCFIDQLKFVKLSRNNSRIGNFSPPKIPLKLKPVTCGRHMKQECHHGATREGVSNRNLKVFHLHSWTVKTITLWETALFSSKLSLKQCTCLGWNMVIDKFRQERHGYSCSSFPTWRVAILFSNCHTGDLFPSGSSLLSTTTESHVVRVED